MSLAAVAFMAPNGRFRNLFITDGGSIVSDRAAFSTDGAGNLTTTSVTTSNVNAAQDPVTSGTLQLVVSSGIQTLVNGANIAAINNTTVLRTTAAANVTALSMPVPISGNGQLSLIINTSTHSMTFDIANNSGMADGTSAVIQTNRMVLSVWNNTEGLYYHT
jgi:hypothetical protein